VGKVLVFLGGPVRGLGDPGTDPREPRFSGLTKFCGDLSANYRTRKIQRQQAAIEGASRAGETCVFRLVREKSEELTG
jgi:hypothetical protein